MSNVFNSYVVMSKSPILEPFESQLPNVRTTRLLDSNDIRNMLDEDIIKIKYACDCREGLVSNLALQVHRTNVFHLTHSYRKIFVYTSTDLTNSQLNWVNSLAKRKQLQKEIPVSTRVETSNIEEDRTTYIRTEFSPFNFSVPLVSFITYFIKYHNNFLPSTGKLTEDKVIKSIIKRWSAKNNKDNNKLWLSYTEFYVCFALYLNRFGSLFPYHYSIPGYGDFSSGISSYISSYNFIDNAGQLADFIIEYGLSTATLDPYKRMLVEMLIKEKEDSRRVDSKAAEVADSNDEDWDDEDSDDEDSDSDDDEDTYYDEE